MANLREATGVSDANNILTRRGEVQSEALAELFQRRRVDAILSSDTSRAMNTALRIAELSKVEVTSWKMLRETKNGGLILPRIRRFKRKLESMTNARAVVVSHAGFIKSLVALIMLGERSDLADVNHLIDHLVIDNGGITLLLFNHSKKRWRVCSVNVGAHLNSA